MRTRTMIRMDLLVGLPLCMLAFLATRPLRWLRPPRPASDRPVRRILVVKFLGLGSILLATPLLRRLRETWPDARITFLTLGPNVDLVRRLGCVDEVLGVPNRNVAALLLAVPGLLATLRRTRFDLAIDLEFYSRLSNLVSWGSGARRRVDFFVRARWRGSLLTDPVYFNPTLPFGRAVMALLKPLGVPPGDEARLVRPAVHPEEERLARARLAEQGVTGGGSLVVVNVNASDLCDERRWPEERFAALIARFEAEVASVDGFAFIGTAAQAPVVARVLDALPETVRARCRDLSGRTRLVDLLVLLRRSALLITNDSGPLHVAGALDVPTVSLFGPETPALYGPVGDNHLVFYAGHWCSPCLSVYNAKIAMCRGHNECMRRLSLEEVVQRTAVFCRERVGLRPPTRLGRPEREVLQ